MYLKKYVAIIFCWMLFVVSFWLICLCQVYLQLYVLCDLGENVQF